MNAIDFLIDQHRQLEHRMQQLSDASAPITRAKLLGEIGDHLTVHIASEEEVFYPAVRAQRTEDILLESLEEHLSLKRLLADLLELSPTEQTFEPKFKVLKEQTEHHHGEEEEHLFPKVRKLLNTTQLEALGDEMMRLQERLLDDGDARDTVAQQTEKAAPLM